MPDQETFLNNDVSESENNIESDAENETSPSSEFPNIDQDIVAECEYAFDNHTFKETQSHQFSEGILLFEVLADDGTTMTIPFAVLKKDHPCDCAKHIVAHISEGRRSTQQPQKNWSAQFLKQCKCNIRRLHAHWGVSHPKIRVRRSRNKKTQEKGQIVKKRKMWNVYSQKHQRSLNVR